MAEVIIMPKMGFNMDEGQLVKWYKSVGETINAGELFFDINTDKTTMPVESPIDGVVLRLLIEEGEFAAVFTPIAVLGNSNEDPDAALAAFGQDGKTKTDEAEKTVASNKDTAATAAASGVEAMPEGLKITPRARNYMKNNGIEPGSLARIRGTGFGGGLTEDDVKAALLAGKTAAHNENEHVAADSAELGDRILKTDFDYDIIVIGAGPGGYVAAIAAAKLKKRVCIIERKTEGGVCLGEGCIPTKTLIKTIRLADNIRRADEFGIAGVDASKISVDIEKLQERKKAVVSQLTGGVRGLLNGNGVAIVRGSAVFKDKNTIIVDGKEISSGYFIIATGSNVMMPAFISVEGDNNIITSREALNVIEIPKKLGIIGGGVIGVEFAYIFSKLGAKVVVFELLDQILPMVDGEISAMAGNRLRESGVRFFTGASVQAVRNNIIYFEHNGKQNEESVDCVLMAVGRSPDTKGLNADGIGIQLDEGAIKTDEKLRTSIPNIYAVGDVNGVSMLAHTASHEGVTAVNNICGCEEIMDYSRVPSCIYLDPEIACIGKTEAQASQEREVRIGKFPLAGNGKTLVEGETDGMVKVILDAETNEILGVHMYGLHVADMIGEISVAMTAEATAEEIIRAIHPHPTVSECIPEAFMNAFGKALHWR